MILIDLEMIEFKKKTSEERKRHRDIVQIDYVNVF